MKPFIFALTLAFIGGLATAYAAERSITQKGKVFSESEVTIKKGDVIVFVNDDNVHHNVLSTSHGNIFNSGAVGAGRVDTDNFQCCRRSGRHLRNSPEYEVEGDNNQLELEMDAPNDGPP